MDQVEGAIKNMARTAAGRERTATNIVKGDFVQKLIAIHAEAEDLESLDDLHALCRVMQAIRRSNHRRLVGKLMPSRVFRQRTLTLIVPFPSVAERQLGL